MRGRNGRAVAVADYDNDGDLDAVVSAIGQPLALLEVLSDAQPRPRTTLEVAPAS